MAGAPQELRCQAPHPAAHKIERFRGRTHNARLHVVIPFPVRFTGRILTDLADVRPGCIGLSCPHRDCQAVHEYLPELSAWEDPSRGAA